MRAKGLKVMLGVAAIGLCSLILSPTAKAADGPAPGEGAYLGAFVGFGSGIMEGKVQQFGNAGSPELDSGTYEVKNGGLGLNGIQGGGWLGFGLKTADDLYLGLEISAAASDEKFELTGNPGIKGGNSSDRTAIEKITAERNWTAGGAIRVGYYVNADTLFSLKGGVAVSEFDVSIGSDKSTYYAGGPQVGAAIETRISKLDPNLSVRLEFVYTDFLTADIQGHDGISGGSTGHNSELTGSDSAGRLGVQYSF